MRRPSADQPDRLPVPLPDGPWRRALRRRLLAWYAREARDLPWRRTRDPYCVWLSEVMLQQTQVATVVGYYERFLRAFPTVAHLAAAEQQQVLRVWEGLGYYRRARQLHEAANAIARHHGGRVPDDFETLGRLPGVGRYTAGAIASIAFDRRAPVLEANTTRLWCRLLALRLDPRAAEAQRALWAAAEIVLPRREPGRMNQALMELGSRVCLPRGPQCRRCPAAALCRARLEGVVGQLPAARQRPAVTEIREVAVVLRHRGRYLLRQLPEGGRWAGLWDFPCAETDAAFGDVDRLGRQRACKAALGSTVQPDVPRKPSGHGAAASAAGGPLGIEAGRGPNGKGIRSLGTIRYTVTRYRVTRHCFEAQRGGQPNGRRRPAGTRWLTLGQMERYPLTAAARRVAVMLGCNAR